MNQVDESWVQRWRGTLSAPPQASELTPPPRFSTTSFENYIIDPAIAGQAAAVAEVQAFAGAGPRRWWQLGRRQEKPGCYLDGDFGVGKTHLLAATWHAAPTARKCFLSFSTAMGLATQLGHAATIDLLAGDLVCMDEFELDDPSNTRLIDLIIAGLIQQGTRLMVTSNTVPGELGQGRMFIDQFRAQLNRVSAAFSDVHVPGQDFRQRSRGDSQHGGGWGPDVAALPSHDHALRVTAERLDRLLIDIPVASLARLAQDTHSLTLTISQPYQDQLAALRLVHLVDRLYDWRVPLRVVTPLAIEDIFLPSYRHLGFAKKYRRCQSRLVELAAEHAADSSGEAA